MWSFALAILVLVYLVFFSPWADHLQHAERMHRHQTHLLSVRTVEV